MLQIGAAAFLLSGAAIADSVDLSTWSANGSAGNWVLQGSNDSVKQTVNTTRPTFFHNGTDSQGLVLSGSITVTGSDDDFIGFVLGYNDGDNANSSADYILIDWKRGNQLNGTAGLAISQVTGSLDYGSHETNGAWTHTNNVNELARATTLGSTGWVQNQEYTFDLIFTSTLIKVFVDGVEELSISGIFSNGSFGFYNLSQAGVTYAGIEQNIAPAVPVPAALFMFAPALLGFMGLRRKAKATIA
ncbi:MAG: PEP-CTERM sorting domain-containing protein [Methylophaga sp.]|nr:MAG: PEP-CTERM sorting domain-containing protein [Methylophaga sp.]